MGLLTKKALHATPTGVYFTRHQFRGAVGSRPTLNPPERLERQQHGQSVRLAFFRFWGLKVLFQITAAAATTTGDAATVSRLRPPGARLTERALQVRESWPDSLQRSLSFRQATASEGANPPLRSN
jgi:hypothetical protein